MGKRLDRHLGRIDTLEPGQYLTDPARHTPATMTTVIVCCPECSFVNPLDASYTVDKGAVSPRYACPSQACSFVDYLHLESWGEPQ